MPDSEANEPSNADLEARIDQLEATIQKMMPTRRGVLTGLAGAGIGGAAVYGASENARAQAAGQVGTDTDPVDVEAWNLNVANQVTSDLAMGGNDVTGVGAMDVESLANDRYYTKAFDGADADIRLDNALSAASEGDVIHLENEKYLANRTISKSLRIIGTNTNASAIGGEWTINGVNSNLQSMSFGDGRLIIDSVVVGISGCQGPTSFSVDVNADRFRFVNNGGGDITFASGTSGGIVDACVRTTVTDNGTNTVGDIA